VNEDDSRNQTSIPSCHLNKHGISPKYNPGKSISTSQKRPMTSYAVLNKMREWIKPIHEAIQVSTSLDPIAGVPPMAVLRMNGEVKIQGWYHGDILG
jgi:hypothetical protein